VGHPGAFETVSNWAQALLAEKSGFNKKKIL
jgi:hypothetical protein